MLTNIYYYKFYRPYILRENNTENVRSKAKSNNEIYKKENTVNSSEDKFLLNKAFNKNVITYVRDVSKNVIEMRDSASDLEYTINNYSKYVNDEGIANTKDRLEDSLTEFIEKYNSSYQFSSEQDTSVRLKNYAKNTQDLCNELISEKLSKLISFDNGLTLHADFFKTSNVNEIKSTMKEFKDLLDKMNQEVESVLEFPLTAHMDFKGLGYYYNYEMGKIKDNTFKIIESGLLVDMVV